MFILIILLNSKTLEMTHHKFVKPSSKVHISSLIVYDVTKVEDWSPFFFSFSLGNKMQRVTCKSCEAKPFSKIHAWPIALYFTMKMKKNYFYYCKLVIIRHVPIFAIFVSALNEEFTYWRIQDRHLLRHSNTCNNACFNCYWFSIAIILDCF